MALVSKQHWETLERWTPTLFIVGFVLELIFAINNGAAYLMDSVAFYDWIYPSVLIGRFAVLLGLAGLSVSLIEQTPRLGNISRILLGATMLFTIGLVSLSILQIVGVSTPVIAVFGIGTVVLTILSFVFFGVVGIRTDAYPAVVGGLLLVATLAVLFVLLSSGTLSTTLRGAVGEGVNATAFLAIWYVLSTQSQAITTTERTPDTPAK